MGLDLKMEEARRNGRACCHLYNHESSGLPVFDLKHSIQPRDIMHGTHLHLRPQLSKLAESKFNSFDKVLMGL